MRELSTLAFVAALLLTSSAFAAGKRAKPKHKAAASAPSAVDSKKRDNSRRADDKTSRTDDKPEPARDSPVSETPPETQTAAPLPDKPEPHEEAAVAASTVLGTDPAPTPINEKPSVSHDSELGALSEQEAARIASGRTEVAVSVGAGVGSRHFRYSDPVGLLLAPYRLSIAPLATFELEAYPLASTNLPVLRDLGFRGHLTRAFAVNSKTSDGAAIHTSWTRFGGDLRYRVIAPGRHRFELGILAGVDASYFVMSTSSQFAALVPSARSVSVRVGFDSELLANGRFSLLLGGAYLATTSPGEIYERFRESHVAGVDATLGCALGLGPGLSGRLTGEYTRYFASFKPKLGDPTVAGGALDEQWQVGLGVRYAH